MKNGTTRREVLFGVAGIGIGGAAWLVAEALEPSSSKIAKLISQLDAARDVQRNELADAIDRIGASRISRAYRSMIPGTQQAGEPGQPRVGLDVSGHGGHAYLAAGYTDAEAWANSGYMTTEDGTGKGLFIPNARSRFDLSNQSVIIGFVVNRAVNASSSDFLCGNSDTTAAQGVYLSLRQGEGRIRPVLLTSGGLVTDLPDSRGIVADGTDHAVMIAICGQTKSVFLFIDGELSDQHLAAFTGGTPEQERDWNFGAAGTGALERQQTVGAKFKGFHQLVFDGPVPLNLSEIARKMAAVPQLPLKSSDILA